MGASAFVPKKSITIKNQEGRELNLDAYRRKDAPASPIVEGNPPLFNQTHQKRASVRMETSEAREKRLAEEKEKEEKVKKAEEEKKAAEEKKRKEEEEKKAGEEKRKREEEERRKKEEEERVEKERIRKEEERARKEEEERTRKEEERIRKEEEAKKAAEEEEKRRREREEEERKAADAEKLRLAKEAEERRIKEEEEKIAARLAEAQKQEEGEIIESPIAEEPPQEAREILSRKEALKIDTSITKTRPGPLDLSGATKNIPAALPSALATARVIEDLDHISYPEGISSPKPELNANSKKGKFRYDREFLLQFMAICIEKPDVPLDVIGLEAANDQPHSHYPMTRTSSGRHRTSSAAMPPPLSRQASVSGFKSGTSGGFTMGNFSTPTSKMTSEERFAISQRSTSSTVPGQGMPFGRQGPMTRTSSQGGPGNNRTRSKRGGERNESNKVHAASIFNSQTGRDQAANFEPVAPLEVSANRWTRKSPADDEQSVERKVKALLNKLTMEKFDSISDQIIAWANKSETEKDGRTLIHVIRLVFEKATDEAAWSEMYARLCRKMMETISPNVQDDGIRNTDGKPIAGGQLFRKYLLNRCQEDFERGWAAKDAAASAAAAKASEDAAVKKAAEASGEAELYSDEYYVAQKAKRRGLGLIQFIGELYKLQMLTERIMHECIKKLLGNVDNPEEEEIESLCRLLTTVGRLLDNPKARAHMDIYFTRMKELGKSNNVAPRMQFMLQDLIELRERKWIPRNQIAAPTTIAQVHEEAAKQRAQAEKDAANRTLAMSRGGSRRGGDRSGGPAGEQQADGWSVAGGSTPRPPSKAGDLSNFGKINKSGPVVMGPSSVWAGKKDAAKRDSTLTRVNSSSNMFMMLGRDGEAMPETGSKPSRPSSRRTSVDLGVGGAAEPQRRKLQLLPRSKPVEEENKANGDSPDRSEDEGGDETQVMSEDEANRKIAEDVKEFFGTRIIEESEVYFTKLPPEHHHLLVDKLVSRAIESKEADGKLVADAFARAVEKNLCSESAFEEGFSPIAESLDDIAIDAPKAFQIMATMMKGAGLDRSEEQRTRIAQKSMDSDKLLRLLA